MKIVVLDGYAVNPGDISWQNISTLGELIVHHRTPANMTVENIADAEIVFTNKTPITKEVFDGCPAIRYVGVLATGYNVVDLEYARSKGITVTNIPDYSTSSVCQFVFALLLEICNNVKLHSDSVHAGEWVRCPDFTYWKTPLLELAGKTLGVFGYGSIGSSVAATAKTFGMNVICNTRTPSRIKPDSGVSSVSFEELLAKADVISLHSPLTVQTQNIINSETINQMKTGVIIINTARGPLVKESDMRQALESGKVAYYAADVVSKEPMEKNNPLLGAKNCIITPHIAWAARESRLRLMEIAFQNLNSYLQGCPQNVVN